MTLLRASDVTVYAVGFLNNQSSATKAEQRARLHQISEATGGQAFFPTTMKDVEAAYDKVVAQIRAQYSLGYTSTNTNQDGNWRKVEIKVNRPDARVQARKGYFAPYKK
jgi:VWFA-related protein